MDEQRLAEIEARANAAAPAPWSEITVNSEQRKYIWAQGYWLATMHDAWFPMAPNAEFIAHAREDVPALIAEVRRLRGELAAP